MTNTATKRGRPRRETGIQNGYSLSNELRSDVQNLIHTCPTCGKPADSVAGLAKKMGVAPLTLGNFLKGKTGLSQDTLDKVAGYIWAIKNGTDVEQTVVTVE